MLHCRLPSVDMAMFCALRGLLTHHRSVSVQHRFGLIPIQLASTWVSRRLCTAPAGNDKVKPLPVKPENQCLLENLELMGVDVRMARQRQPAVLCKPLTNEQGLAHFLQGKGASPEVIASIISRYPRAITRSSEELNQRWKLWKDIFITDKEIVSILARSPEPFFRSTDNSNLVKNIDFLNSLGLSQKDLHRLLTTAPRIFSNSPWLNRQMVEFLENLCVELGGENPEQFVKRIISRNLYILIRSTRRVKLNIDNLRTSLKLNGSELLAFLQGSGIDIVDLSPDYLKNNFNNLEQKLASLGCQEAEIKERIINYPLILFIGPEKLNSKIDCLLKSGITIQQILEKPRVLEHGMQSIMGRLEKLKRVGYDFKKNGIGILDLSKKRFDHKTEKLSPLDK
ncbi:transcription termination factor 1, mitochondrial [Pholidichthys leucotaenia]